MKDGKATAEEERKSLEREIERHDRLYWEKAEPEIDDEEYDGLVRRLEELDPASPLAARVNAPSARGGKVRHSKPMLSLGKVYDKESLRAWMEKTSRGDWEVFLFQPKYDGITGRIENGVLSTRGDGEYGEDITRFLPLVDVVGGSRDDALGEIVISDASFNTLFKSVARKDGGSFKNQRNAVAGIVGSDDVGHYASQGVRLTLVDYRSDSLSHPLVDFDSVWDSVVSHVEGCGYPVDGIVVKLADESYSESLGNTGHHPRGAVAFKFCNKSAETELLDVEVTMGKEQFSAVGVVSPVELGGVTISRVKLPLTRPVGGGRHLLDGSLCIGDKVVVERAGDVIPHVKSSFDGDRRRMVALDKCPFCGGAVEVLDTAVKCSNPTCPEKLLNSLLYSLECLGFVGIGRSMLGKLMSRCGVSGLLGFMRLSEQDMADSGIGVGNACNIHRERERVRTNEGWRVLSALDVDGLGKAVSKTILSSVPLEDAILLSSLELSRFDGVGDVLAERISSDLSRRRSVLADTIREFNVVSPCESLAGKPTVCFTGKASVPRGELEKIAEGKGLVVVGGVSKGLSYLVLADKDSLSSKARKARDLGVKLLSEDEFMDMDFS